jgi:hypothetical protein
MDLEIMPLTEAGRRFTALAEDHARDFATRAERHDREGSFPVENIEALRRSGASGATVPSGTRRTGRRLSPRLRGGREPARPG